MGSGFLHVSQGHAGVQGGGDERMPQRVRPDVLGDPGAAGNAADDSPGAVPVQPPPVRGEEDRSLASLADSQIDRPRGARRQRDGDGGTRPAVVTGGSAPTGPAFRSQ
jgi:hypothetical protein